MRNPKVDDKEHLLENIFGVDKPSNIPEPVWEVFSFSVRASRSKLEDVEYSHPEWYERLWSEVLRWHEGRVGVRIQKEE
jgi:hypothetical protein